jgi:hypothetical protein
MGMRIIRADAPIPEDLRGAALALGNFDGVHKGHQAVIAAARARGAPLAAAVFEPHPRDVFQPDAAPFRLQSAGQRACALAGEGVAAVIEIGFDRTLAALSPEEFCTSILRNRIAPRTIVVGFDFRFGKDRAGGVDFLKDRGGGGKRQAGAAELLRDQRAEVAGFGQGVDEGGGVAALAVQLAPVFTGEAAAQLAHLLADFGVRVLSGGVVHGVCSLAPGLGPDRAADKLQPRPKTTWCMIRPGSIVRPPIPFQ